MRLRPLILFEQAPDNDSDPHNTECNVGSVEPDQRVECRTEGTRGHTELFMLHVFVELVNLQTKESQPQNNRYPQPQGK